MGVHIPWASMVPKVSTVPKASIVTSVPYYRYVSMLPKVSQVFVVPMLSWCLAAYGVHGTQSDHGCLYMVPQVFIVSMVP